MSKTDALKTLRVIRTADGLYFVAHGEGLTFRCHGTAYTDKAARRMLAGIKREPVSYFQGAKQ